MNRIIEKQIDKSYRTLSEKVKNDFLESIKDLQLPIERDVISGVGNINDMDLQAVESLNSYTVYDEHLQEGYCEDPNNCECEIDNCYSGIYTDASMNQYGEFDKDKATIIIVLTEMNYQVIKSPVTEKHGLASICCLGQADIDSDGEELCYALPEEYKQW
jgi:hypothetical protein